MHRCRLATFITSTCDTPTRLESGGITFIQWTASYILIEIKATSIMINNTWHQAEEEKWISLLEPLQRRRVFSRPILIRRDFGVVDEALVQEDVAGGRGAPRVMHVVGRRRGGYKTAERRIVRTVHVTVLVGVEDAAGAGGG